MTNVTRFLGAPGCGKTTQLKRALQSERDEHGTRYDGAYWLAFTRAGAEDTQEAFNDVYGPDVDDLEDLKSQVRTLHSLALLAARSAGIIEDYEEQVITTDSDPGVFQEFCDEHGLRFDPDAGDLLKGDKSGPNDAPTGNKLFKADEFLRHRQLPTKRVVVADHQLNFPMSCRRVHELLQEWRNYKRTHTPRLFQHSDYVAEVLDQGATPDAQVLLFDEFQDFCAQELALYELWRDSVDRVYIAGDPAQSIYGFRGASPESLEDTHADETHRLRSSYRCPSNIADVAAKVLTEHRETTDYKFTGRTDGGQVRTLNTSDRGDGPPTLATDLSDRLDRLTESWTRPTQGENSSPAVMVLARTRRRAMSISRNLRRQGVPYHWLSSSMGWGEDMGRMKLAAEQLSEGKKPIKQVARPFVTALPGKAKERIDWNRYGIDTTANDLLEVLPGTPLESSKKLDIDEWRREAIVRALEADTATASEAVAVGTLHASKGLEAPHVYVDTYAPKQVRQAYRGKSSGGEEHRVHYVGFSRASDTLTILDPADAVCNPAVRGVLR